MPHCDLSTLATLIERSRKLKEEAARLLEAAANLDASISDELTTLQDDSVPVLTRGNASSDANGFGFGLLGRLASGVTRPPRR